MNALLRPLTLAPLGLAATLILGPGVVPGLPEPEPLPVAAAPDGGDADLEQCMEALKTNLKTVAAGLERADGDTDTLKALGAMQIWALKAKALDPPRLASLPAGKQAEHAKDFRTAMATLLRELFQIEIDVLEGKRDAALERVKGDLLALRDDAHERFQDEDH